MIRLIIEAVLLYFVFKFIFEFLVPLFSAGKKSNATNNGYKAPFQSKTSTTATPKQESKTKKEIGEYIDYEEVK